MWKHIKMTVESKRCKSFRKQKVVAIECNAKKKQFVVETKRGDIVTVGYNERPLDSTRFGYTEFNRPSLSAAKEKQNQCVLCSIINCILMLLREDSEVSNIVAGLREQLLDDARMRRRCAEYKEEHSLKTPGVMGSPSDGWYPYDLRNLIIDDVNSVLRRFGYVAKLSANLSRVFCSNSKFLVRHKDRCNKAYLLMGYHVGAAARKKHSVTSRQLALGNFADRVRCNFEGVCKDQTRGSKHAVTILFDERGNGAMVDPDPLKAEYKALTLDTYISSCINVFACYEVFVHKICSC